MKYRRLVLDVSEWYDNRGVEVTDTSAVPVFVSYLVERGVPAKRLVAAGFGEFQPIEEGDTEEVLARNRRIELKLTER